MIERLQLTYHWKRFFASYNEFRLDVNTVRCCISRQVNFGFASRANAKTPAASGAAADVPECVFVHLPK